MLTKKKVFTKIETTIDQICMFEDINHIYV